MQSEKNITRQSSLKTNNLKTGHKTPILKLAATNPRSSSILKSDPR